MASVGIELGTAGPASRKIAITIVITIVIVMVMVMAMVIGIRLCWMTMIFHRLADIY